MIARPVFPLHALMFRRSCITTPDLFDETLRTGEDHELWIRLAARHLIDAIDQPLAYYRVHERMLTREDVARNLGNGILLRQRILRMAEFERVGARPKAEFYTALGAHYFQLGRMAEARESFVSAIRLSPLYARPYALLGASALGKSGYDFALALYRGVRSHQRPIEA
jgi:hypothetical protein